MTGRRVWLLARAALAACAALVAVTQTAGSVELLDRHSGIRALEAKSEDHAFANDWDGWLRKVHMICMCTCMPDMYVYVYTPDMHVYVYVYR